jgi:hypothetical protein
MSRLYLGFSRKLLGLIILVLFVFSLSYAQIIAPDFTLTDTKGNTYNLYQELDAGKTVVLDFFTLSCGSCADGVPVIEQVWQNGGANGSDLWVWGIESYYGSNSAIDSFINYHGGTYPCFSTTGSETILALYQVNYTPRYFVVGPNREMKIVTADNVQEAVNSTLSVPINTIAVPGDETRLISIEPVNPVSVSYYSRSNTYVSFEVYDLLGNLKNKFTVSTTRGYHTVNVGYTGLDKGYYILRMFENYSLTGIRKFTVS